MPRISIILPTYNGAKFLRPQIDSILAQTADDFELIAIDDGSRDDTVAILDDYARLDPRVRRLPSDGNRGQNRRLVELLAAASGTFVAIADQDDIWDAQRNEKLLTAIGDRAIAFGRSQLIDSDGRDLGLSVLDAKGVSHPGEVGPLDALFVPLMSAHAAIIRRSWIDQAAFYGPVPFDLALGVEALFSAGMVYVDDSVVRHRIHGGNQMNGAVVPGTGRPTLLSRYRARVSLSMMRVRRIALYQLLAHLGRSIVLESGVRSDFRHIADTCWNVWFGIGGRSRSLEREFHQSLARHAASPADLAGFSSQVRSLTRSRLAPVNLALALRHYRSGAN